MTDLTRIEVTPEIKKMGNAAFQNLPQAVKEDIARTAAAIFHSIRIENRLALELQVQQFLLRQSDTMRCPDLYRETLLSISLTMRDNGAALTDENLVGYLGRLLTGCAAIKQVGR